jgi:hypothetical protein
MPLDPTKLQPHDPRDLAWAVAWVRLITGDTLEAPTYSDEHLSALALGNAFTHDGVSYYRPHHTAIALLRDRPDSERIDNASRSCPSSATVAAAILHDYPWVNQDDTMSRSSCTP